MDSNIVWKCPACGMPQSHPCEECPQCGVIVAKYNKPKEYLPAGAQENDQGSAAHSGPGPMSASPAGIRSSFGYKKPLTSKTVIIGVAAFVGLAILALPFIENPTEALFQACGEGDEKKVKRLLKKVDPNSKVDGRSLIMVASQNGHTRIVEALLDSGANINDESQDRLPGEWNHLKKPLIWAAEYGHGEVVHLLLKRGAAPNQIDANGNTALMYACKENHVDVVNTLISAGADVRQQNIKGRVAMYFAASHGHPRIIRTLLDYERQNGIDVNSRNIADGALILAAQGGHVEAMKILIQSGANINAKATDGTTALMLAATPAVIDLLVQNGARVAEKNNKGRTALETAVTDIFRSRHECVERLLRDRGTHDRKDDALILAAAFGNFKDSDKIVEMLLDAGADINVVTTKGEGLLELAASDCSLKVVELLLNRGANRGAVSAYYKAEARGEESSEGKDPNMLHLEGFPPNCKKIATVIMERRRNQIVAAQAEEKRTAEAGQRAINAVNQRECLERCAAYYKYQVHPHSPEGEDGPKKCRMECYRKYGVY
ncbi:MAG: ankyrin repeat domain-containing protein [Desulfomonile tiedjei]|nr:ankyrin repeat domain-containing protein [Desulfomonile tiedjei]